MFRSLRIIIGVFLLPAVDIAYVGQCQAMSADRGIVVQILTTKLVFTIRSFK